jgi:hypothetical protein
MKVDFVIEDQATGFAVIKKVIPNDIEDFKAFD